MFTRFDKAGAAAIGSAVSAIAGVMFNLDAEVTGAISVLVATLLVYLVPNKAVPA